MSRLTLDEARQLAHRVSTAVLGGRESLRFADDTVSRLDRDGYFELASQVRCAAFTRARNDATRRR